MSTRTYHPDGSTPAPGQIFVFGSNLSGIHGGGAARAAHKQYGAEWGVAEGRTGQCYALPTVQEHIAGPLSLGEIAEAVERFLALAAESNDQFFVTRIGCGLAGHRDEDIAPMFAAAPANCSLPDTWKQHTEFTPNCLFGTLVAAEAERAVTPTKESLSNQDRIDIDMAMHRYKQPLPGNPLVDGYEADRQARAIAIEQGSRRFS